MPGTRIQRFVRFTAKSSKSGNSLLGQPVDDQIDVGRAVYKGDEVRVAVWSGASVLDPGKATNRVEVIGTLLAPLAQDEVGTIRCIGLNYKQHADEVNMQHPTEPTLFMKPSTALADPYPAPTIIPKWTVEDDCADYESELAVVISRVCKDVSEREALDYVLGYTASNDVSSRASQFSQSQWCFSKGFDGSCPIGPTLVLRDSVPDPSRFHVRGLKNGRVMQDCGCDDLIFSVAKLVSFLSQGTTLPAGTLIITGTPAGVGIGKEPKELLTDGDQFSVEILPYIGTLTTEFKHEK